MINMNIKALRIQHQLTQEEIAERLNVSRQVIAKWEKGDSTPDIQYCMELAKLYNVTLDNLVQFKQQENGFGVPPKEHFFGTATLGERGQIVIPKKARELFQLNPGDTLIILGDEERGLAIVPEQMISSFLNMVNLNFKQEEDK